MKFTKIATVLGMAAVCTPALAQYEGTRVYDRIGHGQDSITTLGNIVAYKDSYKAQDYAGAYVFVYMSLRLDKKKDEDRNFIETYTITLTKGFVGDSLSLMINDSVLVNKKITEEPFSIDVKRFAEQSALFIVDNKTEKLSLFELSERGGTYRFEKENEEVKQLSQK